MSADAPDASALDSLGPIGPLQLRLRDVREYQLPRLLKCTTVAMARDLAAEARSDLEAVRIALEDAHEEAESLPGREREAALASVAAVEHEYTAIHNEYRAALVAAKKASAAAARKHELLEPLEEAPRAESSAVVGGDDALQTKTNEVTDALRRTTHLLQTELERSVLSTQMLKESTNTLRSTQSLYDNYTALLTASGQLVRAIERADWWDRALIAAAFTCFLLTVLWIIKQRVVNRVGGAAVWWVGGSFKLLRMVVGGGSPKAVKDVATAAGEAAVVGGAASSAAAAARVAAEGARKAKVEEMKAVEDGPVVGVDSAVKPRVDAEPQPDAKKEAAKPVAAKQETVNPPVVAKEGLKPPAAKQEVVKPLPVEEAGVKAAPVPPAVRFEPEDIEVLEVRGRIPDKDEL